jgi:hypothetical protein
MLYNYCGLFDYLTINRFIVTKNMKLIQKYIKPIQYTYNKNVI